MKNLIHESRNLDNLPKRETYKDPDKWNGRSDVYHFVDNISPWTRIKRILKKYKGKQFSKAFSEYCSQVPQYQQRFFLEEIENHSTYRWKFSGYYPYWYVDSVGNIQYNPGSRKKDSKVYFYSDDFKTEKRHKVTGKLHPCERNKKDPWYWRWDEKVKEKDYHNVVVSGYCLEFKNAKDPEWIRLTTDQRKRRKAAERVRQKEAKAKALSFISKTEIEAKKERENNKLKIERKGFDFAKSFRNENQINPEFIPTQQ